MRMVTPNANVRSIFQKMNYAKIESFPCWITFLPLALKYLSKLVIVKCSRTRREFVALLVIFQCTLVNFTFKATTLVVTFRVSAISACVGVWKLWNCHWQRFDIFKLLFQIERCSFIPYSRLNFKSLKCYFFICFIV